jgi:hypothetical protein
MRTVPLDEYATGTAAADGTCVVSLGPVARQMWQVSNEAVQCQSPAVTPAAPTAKLYTGPTVAGAYLAGTYDGVNDSAQVAVTLRVGGRLTALWEGCDPGSLCTLSLYGTMGVPG